MIGLKIEITPKDIAERVARLEASLPQKIEETRKKLADLVLKSVKKHTPVKTGALRASLRWVSAGKVDVLWGNYYGEYVITGTRPHEIVPKQAKALRFEVNGQVIFAKRVMHPGTAPNDFRARGLADTNYKDVLKELADWMKAQVAK